MPKLTLLLLLLVLASCASDMQPTPAPSGVTSLTGGGMPDAGRRVNRVP